MSVEFVNAYIERLVKEVQELTKSRLLLETQMAVLEKVNTELVSKLDKYEKAEDRAAKKNKKEVDTSQF